MKLTSQRNATLVKSTDPKRLTDLLEALPPDETADIMGHIDPKRQEQILEMMPPEGAEGGRKLLHYPPDTAGGIMSPDFIAVKEEMGVEGVLQALRENADAESIFYMSRCLKPSPPLNGFPLCSQSPAELTPP